MDRPGQARGGCILVSTSIQLDPDRLSRLIGIGCEAGLDEAAWRDFANVAAGTFGCQLAVIELHRPDGPQTSFLVAGGLDGYEEACRSTLVQRDDDLYWKGMKDKPAGTVRLGTDMVTPEYMRQTRIYSGLAMPWRLEHFLFSAITTGGDVSAYLSLARTDREPAFIDGDKALISQLLLPHLQRSIDSHRELQVISSAHGLLASALDQSPDGIIVFDGEGRPIFISQEASAVFSTGDGLTLVNGALHAANPIARSQLAGALSTALHLAGGKGTATPPVVAVSRDGNSGHYQVVFMPLGHGSGHADFASVAGGVMGVIRGAPRESPADLPAVLRATYNLSRAEIRVCESLLKGDTLLEAANALGVSRNTAKTHLARIFEKTGVHSQAALLRLMALRGGANLPILKGPSIIGSGT